MKVLLACLLVLLYTRSYGQDGFILQGDYTPEDSARVMYAFQNAQQAVEIMYEAMQSIWMVDSVSDESKKAIRTERWKNNETFTTWLGSPEKMGLVARHIRQIHKKFDKKVTLEVIKEDEGRCNRFVGAWAVPYGPVKIRLCRNFLNLESDISSKILVHEVGHESGMLFHRKIFNCRGALNAAAADARQAKLNPETYAWLAMSYLGLDCYADRRGPGWRMD